LKTFQELGIDEKYIQALNELNIIEPTAIQTQVIPQLLEDSSDIIAQAQTGTGKTAAFGLPLLSQIDAENKVVQALILCPTRELGQQIAKQIFKFTKHSDKVFTEAVYGGAPIDKQISALRRPTHIVVATPGRLIDLLKREAVDLSNVKTVVLDEADEMLSMGFRDELHEILSFVSSKENTWLFSATMPSSLQNIIQEHMSPDARKIEVAAKDVVNKKIEHRYVITDEHNKYRTLVQAISSRDKQRGIIFCRTKAATKELCEKMAKNGFAVGAIHGDLQQKERDKVMRAFKNTKLDILIATDIAARGIDIPALSYVMHYELPDKNEYYTHRSGRTARAGKDGLSLCILLKKELKAIENYERILGIEFNEIQL